MSTEQRVKSVVELLAGLSSREFVVWVATFVLAILLLENPDHTGQERVVVYCALSVASSAFIGFRSWTKRGENGDGKT